MKQRVSYRLTHTHKRPYVQDSNKIRKVKDRSGRPTSTVRLGSVTSVIPRYINLGEVASSGALSQHTCSK